MKKRSTALELDVEEWVGCGQQEMCQMRNPRREQDSNSNMNLILQPPLVVVVQ